MRWAWLLAIALALPAPLAAEEACIKYHKCIPLDQFKCTEITRSSFIKRVCYSESKRYMAIKLKDIYYHYCEIGPEIIAALFSAPSMGNYYNSEIKSAATNRKFDCRDHPIPEL